MANDMQTVGAVGKDLYDKERWRKMVSATATPQWELS